MRRKSYFAFIAAGLLFFGPGLLCDAQTVVEIVTDVGCPRQIVKKSIPEYPDNLIDSGAEGRVIVLFEINEGGKVTFATLCRRIHPFLDKLAVESVKRWEFKPCVFDGDVMRTLASVDFFFYPSTSSGARKPEEPENEELKTLLDRCGEYCDKLTAYATFFVCHEKVMEKVNEIHLNEDDISHGKDVLRHIYPVLGGGRRNRYLYDYQLIRKDGETQERRTWLDGCGKEIAGHEISAGETRPWSIKAILVPGMLFSREQRARFSYKMAEGEKVKGRPAYLIEVRPRAGLGGDFIWAKVWVEKEGCRVLKAEVETARLPGYDEMTKECLQYHLRAHFKEVHLYGLERNGILFPNHSELLVEYAGLLVPKRDTKAKTEIDYEQYRFFSTATDYLFKGIKKKPLFLMPTLPRPASGFIFWR